MKVRFRGFDNPVIIPAPEPKRLIPPLGTFTVGRVYTANRMDNYTAPSFHQAGDDRLLPDVEVLDDNNIPSWVESLFWDLVEE